MLWLWRNSELNRKDIWSVEIYFNCLRLFPGKAAIAASGPLGVNVQSVKVLNAHHKIPIKTKRTYVRDALCKQSLRNQNNCHCVIGNL